MPPFIGSFQRALPRMHTDTKSYPPTPVMGAIVLSKLDIPQGRHALDSIAVSLVTGLLDRLPSRGEYRKVICCDIYVRHGTHQLTCENHFASAIASELSYVKENSLSFCFRTVFEHPISLNLTDCSGYVSMEPENRWVEIGEYQYKVHPHYQREDRYNFTKAHL